MHPSSTQRQPANGDSYLFQMVLPLKMVANTPSLDPQLLEPAWHRGQQQRSYVNRDMLVTVFEDQTMFGRRNFRVGSNAGEGLICDYILVKGNSCAAPGPTRYCGKTGRWSPEWWSQPGNAVKSGCLGYRDVPP